MPKEEPPTLTRVTDAWVAWLERTIKAKKISIVTLADEVGVSRAAIYNLLGRSKTTPRPNHCEFAGALHRALGATPPHTVWEPERSIADVLMVGVGDITEAEARRIEQFIIFTRSQREAAAAEPQAAKPRKTR